MPSTEYFFYNADCQDKIFDDWGRPAWGAMKSNPTYAYLLTCQPGNGIKVTGGTVQSTWMAQSLNRPRGLHVRTFTLDFWLTFSTFSTNGAASFLCANQVLTNGKIQSGSQVFNIYQSGNTLYAVWQKSNPLQTSWTIPSTGTAYHLVVIFYSTPNCGSGVNYQTVTIYINGSPMATGTNGCDSTVSWQNGDVNMFNQAGASTPIWSGWLWRVAFYERALTINEIYQNYLAGVPGEVPVAYDVTFTVFQYGIRGNNTKLNPWSTLLPIPTSQLVQVGFSSADPDDKKPYHPNYRPNVAPPITLVSLPPSGSLYTINNMAITQVPYTLPLGNVNVRFRPNGNGVSGGSQVFTSFQYYVADKVTPDTSNTATISVIVAPIHMPPQPVNRTMIALYGLGNVTTLLSAHSNPSPVVKAYIVGQPQKGQLYQVAADNKTRGAPLGPGPITPVTNRGMRVFYWYTGPTNLPERNGQIYTDQFYYQVQDAAGYFSVYGKMKVSVMVPQPPVATNASIEARAGRYTIMVLEAYCAARTTLKVATITALPTVGQLYQVFGNGSVDVSSPLGGKYPTQVPLRGGIFRVCYVYTSNRSAGLSEEGVLSYDGFLWKVEDMDTLNSTMAKTSLTIKTILEAVVLKPARKYSLIPQNTPSLLRLYGGDYQDPALRRRPCFQILTLPDYGVLKAAPEPHDRFSEDDMVWEVNTLLPYTIWSEVWYEPMQDFFNLPERTWFDPVTQQPTESFTYRVVACEDFSLLSFPATQDIVVQYVNNPTQLSNWIYSSPLDVYAVGSLSPVIDKHLTINDTLTIEGWQVYDPDWDADPVMVAIYATYGIVKFDLKELAQADFTSVQYCHPEHKIECWGSGDDRYSRFRIQPDQLQALLNTMYYRCTYANVNDTLTVAIFDGQGGECLPSSAFDRPIDRSAGCYMSSVNLSIEVGESDLLHFLKGKKRFISYTPLSYYVALIWLICFGGGIAITVIVEYIEQRFDSRLVLPSAEEREAELRNPFYNPRILFTRGIRPPHMPAPSAPMRPQNPLHWPAFPAVAEKKEGSGGLRRRASQLKMKRQGPLLKPPLRPPGLAPSRRQFKPQM